MLREEMQVGLAELRTGQVRIREDIAAFGARLAVVEHRIDGLEVRLAVVERRTVEWPEADAPVAGSGPSASSAGAQPGGMLSH